ncbi:MAG: hypothetical protein ACKO6F_03575 [Cyanobium sp.]
MKPSRSSAPRSISLRSLPQLPALLSARLAALLLIGAPLFATAPALAQQQPARPAAPPPASGARPATPEEVNTYMTMSAINLCALSQQKVPFRAALDGSVSMVASVLTEKHGSRIAGAANALNRDQVINATVAESVLRSERFCGTKLPPDWRKEYDKLLPEIRKAVSSGGGGSAKPPAQK